jgi:NAD-dependent deacetylase
MMVIEIQAHGSPEQKSLWIQELSQKLEWNPQSRLVLLTGAGISAESGIRTFRDSNGLWEEHLVEDVATPEGFARNPNLVYRFYNERRKVAFAANPNPGHFAIHQLQKILGPKCYLVTQNVDDLHERAGSVQVHHMHGRLNQARCVRHKSHQFPWNGDLDGGDLCSICTNPLRPDIVWFGEDPIDLDTIQEELVNATHFLSIGTSGHVYPAAGFHAIAASCGAKTLHFNLVAAENASDWDVQLLGSSSETLALLVQSLVQSLGIQLP